MIPTQKKQKMKQQKKKDAKKKQKSSKNKYLRLKGKLANLKNLSDNKKKNSLSNSDCYTMEVNKSTNIEDISHIFHDKEKNNSLKSMRNISSICLKFPKIKNIIHRNSSKKIFKTNIRLRYSLSFKKMLGRKDELFGEQSLNLISYFPNYDFFMPHIPTIIFKHHKNDDELKKYITGKIIRGYKYSPEKYFVFEYKKNKSKRLNLIRERQKIIEILNEKIEE